MPNEVIVQSSVGAYPVRFESYGGPLKSGENIIVITDRNVHAALGQTIPEHVQCIVLEPGEGSKSMATFESVVRRMASAHVSRSSTLVALGGGVVGDLAGFVAATYMRGVDLVQVPTSLLAMVDSSVGGKVGIDLPEGKNMVGAFYPPKRVVLDVQTLSTLPDRHWTNGMAEVWKYAAIADPSLVDAIPAIRPGAWHDVEEVVKRCVQIKADVCCEDEFDRAGKRATLNFGHTVGHALEAALGYERLLHGEAVAIGMVAETRIAEYMGVARSGLAEEIAEKLESAGLPTEHPLLQEHDRLLPYMMSDKKSSSGSIGMSLVVEWGECKLFPNVPEPAIRSSLSAS